MVHCGRNSSVMSGFPTLKATRITDFLCSPFEVLWNCPGLYLCIVVVICPFAPYGLAHGPKLVKFATNWVQTLRIVYLWSRWMDLPHWKFHGLLKTCSCATSYLFAHLHHIGSPMGQKLVKSGTTWARLCVTHIFGTAGWICTIRSSMELSRPVVVQHQGHLTLTLDLQGQILKMLYLRNRRADWHGTKGIWVDMMLYLVCDLQLWLWPWILKVKF